MKTKAQKLGLKKIKVATLSDQEMNIVKAGGDDPWSCPNGEICVQGGNFVRAFY